MYLAKIHGVALHLAVVGSLALASGCVNDTGAPQAGETRDQAEAAPSTTPASDESAPLPDYVIEVIPTGDSPAPIAVGAGSVWVGNHREALVTRIDPATNKAEPIKVSEGANDLIFGFGSVWQFSWVSRHLDRVDPARNKVVAALTLGHGGASLDAGEGGVWMGTEAHIFKIDPTSNRKTQKIRCGYASVGYERGNICAIEADLGAVWAVLMEEGDKLWRFDTESGKKVATIPIGDGVFDLASGFGDLWIISASGTVSRVDPDTNEVVATMDLGTTGGEASSVAAGRTKVWARIDDSTLVSIDPETNEIVDRFEDLPAGEVGGGGVTTGFGSVWVTNWSDNSVWRIDAVP